VPVKLVDGCNSSRKTYLAALVAELASFKLTLDLLRARPFRLDAHALEELVSLSQELLGSFAWR
jgi:hypothetical protein